MSEPRTQYEVPLQGALNELVSAMSSLNMPPEPLPPPILEEGDGRVVYLSELDGWAKHSYAHMRAVFDLITQGQQKMELLRTENFRLLLQVTELKKGKHP